MKSLSRYIKQVARPILLSLSIFIVPACAVNQQKPQSPNIIIIFTDDQGYEDVGVYGSPLIATPHLDQLASDGIRCTDFYVATSVCSPSRASLLTGQLPKLNGVDGVLWPGGAGMNPEVLTIAELLKTKGYATALFGKWHLGDTQDTRPTAHGFDEYYGIPYSNDMFPHFTHKVAKNIQFNFAYNYEKFEWDKQHVKKFFKDKRKLKKDLNYASPIFEGNEVVEYPADQSLLTQKYFSRARDYISKHKNKPFLVFITPSMPHIPLFASERFKGKSKRGLYGDTIEEIDYEIGVLRRHLKNLKLDKNTLIIFSSDNGPWLSFKEHGGSAGPLRGGKFTNFEGGVRVPSIMAWPGNIPTGTVSNQISSTMDLFPTIAEITGAELSANHKLNGQSLLRHLRNPSSTINRDVHFYSLRGKVAGVRKGDWKYIRAEMVSRQKKMNLNTALLFNLKDDVSETHNLIDKFPQKVVELEQLVQDFEKTL